jgi:hypothetical protein
LGLKVLKLFDEDLGSGMEKSRIRDPRINNLDPQHCQDSETPELLAVVADLRPQLRELRVEHPGFPHPQDADRCVSFARAISRLTDLLSLAVNVCSLLTSQGLMLIASHCRHLRKLDIRGNVTCNVDSIAYVISQGEGRLCKLSFNARDFVDQDYTVLARLSSSLEKLEIQWADNLGPRGLRTIWKLTSLRRLSINFVVHNEFYFSAQDRLEHLVCLHMMSGGFSDLELLSLGRTCPHLEELKMNSCNGITDGGLVSVFRYWQSLQRFKLAYMDRICGTFLVELRRQLPELQCLTLLGCQGIEPVILVVFQRHNPDIQVQVNFHS